MCERDRPTPLNYAPPKRGPRRLDVVDILFDLIGLLVVVGFVAIALWFVAFRLGSFR